MASEIFTPKMKQKYLKRIREVGTVAAGCAVAGVTRETVREHRQKYPDFAAEEEAAREEYRELVIEGEIHRRGVEGWEEPVHYQGLPTSVVRKFSDTLLLAHARRHIPAYREAPSQIQMTQISVTQFSERLAQQQEKRRALLMEAGLLNAQITDGGNGNGRTDSADNDNADE